jgi:DNA polymerase-3 subunit gamma/tau
MARCLNCEKGPTITPCGVCASCTEIAAGSGMDVIEIDAASNRGINEMRELRENVRFRPARDRYKVFIVDEAHQITSEAFNALLKTLEEPPEWVVFMLCTTETHKIPSTIASRCQPFSFRSVDFAELVARMEWIMQQEGIQADPETLSILAQAGEGSVRDSLSALDQAIACCGNKLEGKQVRELLGMFSLESLGEVSKALAEGDAKKMLDVVADLEANGRSLQHFARELARYFRNLLVVRIEGKPTRLVAASPPEQEKMLAAAAQFSEDDLTRDLKLALDLFRDLQSSLQPRLHLEMGLLRLIHAARLQPIEEAIAALGGASPKTIPSAPKAPPVAPPKPAVSSVEGDFRTRLLATLQESKLTHVADAVGHSEVAETPAEITFTAPKMYQMFLKGQEFEAAVRRVAGRTVKISLKVGEAALAAPTVKAPVKTDEAAERALAHPEVKRIQELFPESQVRAVRNLKESEQS